MLLPYVAYMYLGDNVSGSGWVLVRLKVNLVLSGHCLALSV